MDTRILQIPLTPTGDGPKPPPKDFVSTPELLEIREKIAELCDAEGLTLRKVLAAVEYLTYRQQWEATK